MKRLILTLLVFALALAFAPSAEACPLLARLKQGAGRVLGAQRRQANRAARQNAAAAAPCAACRVP